MPEIDNIEEYGVNWRSWYTSMLPKCRVGQKDWPPLKRVPTDCGEWESLRKGSKRGFVDLLVSLSWWEAQATRKKDKEMVSAALKDVLFVVRELAANEPEDDTSLLRKRTRGTEVKLPQLKRCGYSAIIVADLTDIYPGKRFESSMEDSSHEQFTWDFIIILRSRLF